MMTRFLLALCILPRLLAASIPDDVVEKTGMFGMCNYILSLLSAYERKSIDKLKIDFEDKGVFYEESRGPNWWNYYFEPLDLTPQSIERTTNVISLNSLSMREQNHALYKKYIKIKPFLHEKATHFQKQNFKTPFTIGVHYRGTDKKEEYPRTPYFRMKQKIKDIAVRYRLKNYQVFVATDEVEFIEYLKKEFGPKVIYTPSTRSTTKEPIHFNSKNPFLIGQEAIIDCLLLSKCQYLIRTQSNLSSFSTFINPQLPTEIVSVVIGR